MNRYRILFAVVVCVWIGVTMNHFGFPALRIAALMAVWSLACMTAIMPKHRSKFWGAAVVVAALSLAGCASTPACQFHYYSDPESSRQPSGGADVEGCQATQARISNKEPK